MKCDRYIGTGELSNEKEVSSGSIVCARGSSKSRLISGSISRRNKYCETNKATIPSRDANLHHSTIICASSTIQSSYLQSPDVVVKVLPDLKESIDRKETFKEKGDLCRVIETQQSESNTAEDLNNGIITNGDSDIKYTSSTNENKVNNILLN